MNAVPNSATYSEITLSILGEAAERGSTETVSILLDNATDPNGRKKKPLIAAAWNTQIARLLLRHGTDPTMFSSIDPHKRSTPLKMATEENHTEMIKLYKEFGFNSE